MRALGYFALYALMAGMLTWFLPIRSWPTWTQVTIGIAIGFGVIWATLATDNWFNRRTVAHFIVHHVPKWIPTELPVDRYGNTKPGFICVHWLENGNGQCGGNVFNLDEAVGDHCCVVSAYVGKGGRLRGVGQVEARSLAEE